LDFKEVENVQSIGTIVVKASITSKRYTTTFRIFIFMSKTPAFSRLCSG